MTYKSNYSAELRVRELMMQFESLGQNCEFGIVQRAHKAEPLGLLRWANVSVADLIKALEKKFDNFGEPDNVRVRLDRGEYMADEIRYRITYHTYAREGEIAPETLHDRECKRLRYLGGKLLEDLADGQKIFVWKRNKSVTENQIKPLHNALRTFGSNTLLWVVESHAGHLPGTVEWIDDGLMRGYVDHFADPERVPSTTSVEAWTKICANAWRLRLAQELGAPHN
jgi:hypothetical protein